MEYFDEKYCKYLNDDHLNNDLNNKCFGNKILKSDQLHLLLQKNISNFNSNSNKNRRKIKIPITEYVKIKTDQNDYWQTIQLILSLNDKVLIYICDKYKHNKVYWKGCIYNIGKANRYDCENHQCPMVVILDTDNCFYTKEHEQHKYSHCINDNYKLNVIYYLIKEELKYNISKESCPLNITPRMHYDRIIKKYKNKLPILDLQSFDNFDSIRKNLEVNKTKFSKLTSCSMQYFMENQYDKILESHCPSKYHRDKLIKDIVHAQNGESLLISRKKLLNIFFNAIAIGGDGTFSIRPQFVRINGGRHKPHAQVFKIYAFYKYHARRGTQKITKGYLIAIALLESKKSELYKWMFKTILKWGKTIKNKNVQYICDFESAQRKGFNNAIENNVGKYFISGEEFHHKQAIFKNIIRKLLAPFYVKRKGNKKYDILFRKYIELIYNLCYVKAESIQNFAIYICNHLWQYVTNKRTYTKEICCRFLRFIVYYLFGWCECTKAIINNRLSLIQIYANFVNKLKPKKIATIKEWCLNKKELTNTNGIEAENKHHRIKIGYFPTIDVFMYKILDIFDDSIRNYNKHQKTYKKKNYLRNINTAKNIIEKRVLIKKYENTVFTIDEFIKYSAQLTYLKYNKQYNVELKDYFTENDDEFHFTDTDFNEFVKQSQLEIMKEIDDAGSDYIPETRSIIKEIINADTIQKKKNQNKTIKNKHQSENLYGQKDQINDIFLDHNSFHFQLSNTETDNVNLNNVQKDKNEKKTQKNKSKKKNRKRKYNEIQSVSTKSIRRCKLRLQIHDYNPYCYDYSSADNRGIFEQNNNNKNNYEKQLAINKSINNTKNAEIQNLINTFITIQRKLQPFINEQEKKLLIDFKINNHTKNQWDQQIQKMELECFNYRNQTSK